MHPCSALEMAVKYHSNQAVEDLIRYSCVIDRVTLLKSLECALYNNNVLATRAILNYADQHSIKLKKSEMRELVNAAQASPIFNDCNTSVVLLKEWDMKKG